jgi:hypothetical protein
LYLLRSILQVHSVAAPFHQPQEESNLALHISRSRITSNMMRMREGKLRTREDAGANCLISKMHFWLIISKIAQFLEKLTV